MRPWKECDERDDLVASLAVLVERILARQLDRTLVGLRTRVGKKYLARSGWVFSTSFFAACTIGSVVIQVGGVHELVRLLR